MHPSVRRQRGFSLLEIIVILVVAGFLGVLVVNLMSTQVTKSGVPLINTRQAAQAEATLEKITAYYINNVNANIAGALDNVKAAYPNNATLQIVDYASTFPVGAPTDGVRSLFVTVTEGSSTYTTVLTQERTNVADNATTF